MPRSRFPSRALPSFALALALVATAADALADRVARLSTKGSASYDQKGALDKATVAAVAALGHTSPTDKETGDGEAAAGSLEDRSAGLVAIGKVTSSEWVIEPTLSGVVGGQRIEIKACQVSTGRVETLARDLDPAIDSSLQIREVLGLLLRPQGVGDDPLPWEKKSPTTKPPPETPKKDDKTATKSDSKSPPVPDAPPPKFFEGGAIRVGVEGGILGIASRPDHTVGSAVLGDAVATAVVRIPVLDPAKPSLEAAVYLGGVFGAVSAVRLEVGARYAFGVGPRMAVIPELTLGGLFQTSGNGDGRLLAGVGVHGVYVLIPQLELFVHPALRLSPGGSGGVVFASGAIGALFRF